MSTINRNSVIAIALFSCLWLVPPASAFYAPQLQRWVNRDPIGEVGFGTIITKQPGFPGNRNLFEKERDYLFVANSPCVHFDSRGLTIWSCWKAHFSQCFKPCVKPGTAWLKWCRRNCSDVKELELACSVPGVYQGSECVKWCNSYATIRCWVGQ
jgi:hypothetical protein